MRLLLLVNFFVVGVISCVFSQDTLNHDSTPDSITTKGKLSILNTAEASILLNTLPHGDSISNSGTLIGVGVDSIGQRIVVFTIDSSENPSKITIPFTFSKNDTSRVKFTYAQKKLQDGRTWLIIYTTLQSAIVYFPTYFNITDNMNTNTATGLGLLTTGAAMYGTYLYSENRELGYGKVSQIHHFASLAGVLYPLLVQRFLENATGIDSKYERDQYYTYYSSSNIRPSSKVQSWISMFSFPAGFALGNYLPWVKGNDWGRAAMLSYASYSTLGLSYALPSYWLSMGNDNYAAVQSGLAMATIPFALYGANTICKDKEISAGRAGLIWVTGTMGTLSGLVFPLLFWDTFDNFSTLDYQRIFTSSMLAGYGIGTYIGATYNHKEDYMFWQSAFIGASSVGGCLISLAVPFLVQADEHEFYTLAGLLGAWGGFYLGERLSIKIFEESFRDKPHGFNLQLNLPAIYSLAMSSYTDDHKASQKIDKSLMPVANLIWNF